MRYSQGNLPAEIIPDVRKVLLFARNKEQMTVSQTLTNFNSERTALRRKNCFLCFPEG